MRVSARYLLSSVFLVLVVSRTRLSHNISISLKYYDYISKVTGNELVGFQLPDILAITEQSDKQQLGRLLQLILGVVVNCARKQRKFF